MAIYNSNLADIAGQVRSVKPNAKTTAVYKDINARIRRLCDSFQWSSLIASTVLNIPNATSTGSVSITSGSTTVTGASTAWPVSDIANTTMTVGNRTKGYVEITPAEMTGITVDRPVYVSDGVYSEAVPVVEVTSTSFVGNFRYQHNDGTAITCSSLAGQQLQLGTFYPIYTVLAITSTTGAIIDMPFGGASISAASYSILQAYVTIDPLFRDFIAVYDPTQGISLRTHMSQAELNWRDPQRTSSGYPEGLVDRQPSVSGSMQFELWPFQQTAYSIPVIYVKQWPELKQPTDRPPTFIDPSVIVDGACADALRRKDLRSDSDKDPYYDLNAAQIFERKFEDGMARAINADDGRRLQTLTASWGSLNGAIGSVGGNGVPSASWAQQHAISYEGGW